jgi:hypothetical protein
LHGVEAVVRMKSQRGRGGGAENILFEDIRGDVLTAGGPVSCEHVLGDLGLFTPGFCEVYEGLCKGALSEIYRKAFRPHTPQGVQGLCKAAPPKRNYHLTSPPSWGLRHNCVVWQPLEFQSV